LFETKSTVSYTSSAVAPSLQEANNNALPRIQNSSIRFLSSATFPPEKEEKNIEWSKSNSATTVGSSSSNNSMISNRSSSSTSITSDKTGATTTGGVGRKPFQSFSEVYGFKCRKKSKF